MLNNVSKFYLQYNFLKSGGVSAVMNMLTKNNFLPNADMETRRWVYFSWFCASLLLLFSQITH